MAEGGKMMVHFLDITYWQRLSHTLQKLPSIFISTRNNKTTNEAEVDELDGL